MNNPIQQMMQLARSGQNPQQLIMNFLQTQSSPMGQNLLKLAYIFSTYGDDVITVTNRVFRKIRDSS